LKEKLLAKIEDRTARLSVIGLGCVGLPLAVGFAEAGFRVVGVDVNPARVAAINRGESFVQDVPAASLALLVADGRLSATTDYDALHQADAVIICVPTPLSKTKRLTAATIGSGWWPTAGW
jgi:UDP-N-acetyl-D-glucosamine dehydrogenase